MEKLWLSGWRYSGGRDVAEGVSQGSHGGEVGGKGAGRAGDDLGVGRDRGSRGRLVGGRGA